MEKLEAGAWKSLMDHLRARSDEVQNIDMMTISGFCRNCLAKVSSSSAVSAGGPFLRLVVASTFLKWSAVAGPGGSDVVR